LSSRAGGYQPLKPPVPILEEEDKKLHKLIDSTSLPIIMMAWLPMSLSWLCLRGVDIATQLNRYKKDMGETRAPKAE
jgi:hypothetical protein